MKVLWYITIFCIASVYCYTFSMSRSDIVAINNIEKELRIIINSKSTDWQKRAQQLIDQLENQYVPRGYNKESVQHFKNQLRVPDTKELANDRDYQLPDEQKIVQKERIEQTLDDLVKRSSEEQSDEFDERLSSALFDLAAVDRNKAQEYFEKINFQQVPVQEARAIECEKCEQEATGCEQKVTECEQKIIQCEQKAAGYEQKAIECEQKVTECEQKKEEESLDNNAIDYSAVISKLDDLMAVPVDRKNELWERDVNALIFDLSQHDKDKAQNYMKRIYVRADSVPVCIPSLSIPSTNVPQPPSAGVPKPPVGGPPAPPSGSVPKPPAGGPPAPPSGGMPKSPTGGPKPPALPGGKPAQPKPVVMTLAALNKLSESELLTLFDTHLNELKNEWNGMSEKRVEVKTKYGSRVEIVRGEPSSGWNNKVDTIRKSLVSRNIMTVDDVHKKIQDRIDQVRAEKKTALPSGSVVSEKPAEEITQKNVEQQLKILLSNPKVDEMSWIVGVKSSIKTLNTFDHDAALKYQENFIELLPKEKRFIKP